MEDLLVRCFFHWLLRILHRLYCEQRHVFFNGRTVDLSARQQADLCARTFNWWDFFPPTKLFPPYTRGEKKRGGRREKSKANMRKYFIFYHWDGSSHGIYCHSSLAEPQCSCDNWCHPRTCFIDRLRWLLRVTYSSVWFKTPESRCSFIWTSLVLRGSSFTQQVLGSTRTLLILHVLGLCLTPQPIAFIPTSLLLLVPPAPRFWWSELTKLGKKGSKSS